MREPKAGVQPVGFLDDDLRRKGQSIAGVPVLGDLNDLSKAIAATGAKMLLITMPRASGPVIRHVMEAGVAAGLEVRTIPPFLDLIDGTHRRLPRPPRPRRGPPRTDRRLRPRGRRRRPHPRQGRHDHRRRRLDRLGAGPPGPRPAARASWSSSTAPRARSTRSSASSTSAACSGRGGGRHHDLPRQRRQPRRHGPARRQRPAGRHLPRGRLQARADDGGATRRRASRSTSAARCSMLDAAIAAGVPRFVLVSTDKAVEPTQRDGRHQARRRGPRVGRGRARRGRPYVVGPVRQRPRLGRQRRADLPAPARARRAADGHPPRHDPLLHDHPRGGLADPRRGRRIGRAGDLFVLDMGEPVRIMDLARDLIRLSGRPEGGVPIQFTGLRPGEKLHEQLFYEAEQIHSTEVPKVLRAVGDGIPYDIHLRAARILEAATGARDAELRIALFDARRVAARRRPSTPRPPDASWPTSRSPRDARGAGTSGDRVGLMTDVAAPFLPFARPSITDRERAAVLEVLDSGWLTTGPKTKAFEAAFAGVRRRRARDRPQLRDGRAPPGARCARRRPRATRSSSRPGRSPPAPRWSPTGRAPGPRRRRRARPSTPRPRASSPP